jgi:hypothetical protein
VKPLALSFLLSLAFILSGCGGASTAFHANSTPQLDGVWTAQALNGDGTRALIFQALMKQAAGSAVSVKQFSFLLPNPCFPASNASTANFTPANVNGKLTGPFSMTVTATAVTSADNNALTLQGTMNGPVISGTWSMSSDNASCVGSGTFQMDQLPSS